MNRIAARVVRRETHSPRSTAAVIVAILLITATLLVAVESVLHLLGLRPLLVAPRTIAESVLAAPSAGAPALIAAALTSGLVGLWLVALAILPGRRPRRHLQADHVAVVADDEMLASGLARQAARTAAVPPDAVSVSVGRRTATVRITPVSGSRIDRDEVRQAVTEEFAQAGTGHPLRVSVLIAPTGKVGS
ncbi:DUF6286 domain-containing protein [Leifsonia aquatica]|uniref:DUF6286 domain-containing protein n=1 Tax=Leifsonia aquatica TaxID=144185 RepID=UPI00046AD13C|nr:DUF6286 domain-containing protein [Leifsonia aquatica]